MPENKNLDTYWKIFFHDYMDSSWKKESYEPLGTINNIIDFWTIFSVLKDKLSCGMFFFMKEQTFPKWDEENIEYNFLTIKVLKTNNTNIPTKITKAVCLIPIIFDLFY